MHWIVVKRICLQANKWLNKDLLEFVNLATTCGHAVPSPGLYTASSQCLVVYVSQDKL